MPNSLSWDYLNTVPPSNDVIDAWSILMLIVFAGGFMLASVVFYRPGIPPFRGKFGRKSVQFAAGVAIWIFGAGMFFFMIQLLQIDPFTFGRRIWMFLMLIAAIAYLGVVGYRGWRRVKERKEFVVPSGTGAAIQRPAPHRRPVRRRRI